MSEKFDAEVWAAGLAPNPRAATVMAMALRESYAAGAREVAEEIVKEIDDYERQYGARQTSGFLFGLVHCKEIARRHAAPPSPPSDEFLREQQLIEKTRKAAFNDGFQEGLKTGQQSVVCSIPAPTREERLEKALRDALDCWNSGNGIDLGRILARALEVPHER